MDDSVHKSCWSVTAWTVAAFSAVLALAFLFGAAETAVVAAS